MEHQPPENKEAKPEKKPYSGFAEEAFKLMQADKSKAGILMGAVMKELKGKADGADVKAVVEQLLA